MPFLLRETDRPGQGEGCQTLLQKAISQENQIPQEMNNSEPSSPSFAGSYTDNLQKYSAELPNQFDGEMSAHF